MRTSVLALALAMTEEAAGLILTYVEEPELLLDTCNREELEDLDDWLRSLPAEYVEAAKLKCSWMLPSAEHMRGVAYQAAVLGLPSGAISRGAAGI